MHLEKIMRETKFLASCFYFIKGNINGSSSFSKWVIEYLSCLEAGENMTTNDF